MDKRVVLFSVAAIVIGSQHVAVARAAAPLAQHDSHNSTPAPAPIEPVSPPPAAPVVPIVQPAPAQPTSPTGSVWVTSPVANAKFKSGSPVGVAATVAAGSGKISKVEFFANNLLIGSDTTSPYSVVWSPKPNVYSLTAIARTSTGSTFTSHGVTVTVEGATVSPSPAPAPAPVPATPVGTLPPLPAQPLLQKSSLVYEGAFQLPRYDNNGETFPYGGKALAFNRQRGTIMVGGEEIKMKVAELTVPEIRYSTNISSLATAQIVQNLADATDGKWSAIATRDYVKYGGLLPYKGKLYSSVYHWYDGNGLQSASHFVSGMDLTVPDDAQGPVKIGTLKTGYTSGFMTEVPAVWQEALGGPALTGNCCISIISRTSYGPAAFSFDPELIATSNPVPATPLVYYPDTNPLAAWDATGPYFNGTTAMAGVVFPEGYRSVLFFGRHGTGTFCYGIACEDPLGRWQGNHAWPYVYQVWAYDANDLAQARVGLKQPWDVKPYAIWQLVLPIDYPSKVLKGVTYDPATKRIFITQERSEVPLVHVYRVQ